MQAKRKKRSRIRAAKITAGHGHKKKNRGAGHKGGKGRAGSGKRGHSKIMKVTEGKLSLGKKGFTTIKKADKIINLREINSSLISLYNEKKVSLSKEIYNINLTKLGYNKLLSKGGIDFKLHVTVQKATKRAIEKVKNVGGDVFLVENNEKIAKKAEDKQEKKSKK